MSELSGTAYRDVARPAAISDAVWLATGIFVSIANVHISLLDIFSSR